MRIAVFGLGYVGSVTAACLSRDGHHVVGVDVDPDKLARFQAGEAPVAEPGLPELIRAGLSRGKLQVTASAIDAVRQTDIALVAVGTPSNADGSLFTHSAERVVKAIGAALQADPRAYGVVIRSTVLPGILEERLRPLLPSRQSHGCWMANNPEFLREGSSIADYDNPPFILVGADRPEDAQQVFELYASQPGERIVTSTRISALVKYACNAFHANKVAFANEIGALSASLGADGHEVMRLVCRDTKLNLSSAYLRPGFAFGGSCLPKDLRAVLKHAESVGLELKLLSSVLPSNDDHLSRSLLAIESLGERRVGLVGLSFKANTDDLRESPLVVLAERLLGRGYQLKIYDPSICLPLLGGHNRDYVNQHLPHLSALLTDSYEELLNHADLLILGTDVADSLPNRNGFAGRVLDLRRDLAISTSIGDGAVGVGGASH